MRHQTVAEGSRPLSDPGRGRRLVPFALAVLLGAGTLLVPVDGTDGRLAATALGLLALVVLGTVVLPWDRGPAGLEMAPAVAFVLVVALLRHADGGGASGFGPLFVLPLLYAGLYGDRRGAVVVLACIAAALVVPPALLDQDLYPGAEWRRALLWVAVGSGMTVAIQNLVREVRERSRLIAALGEAGRSLATAPDPRVVVAPVARTALGADRAVLVDADDVPTPGPGEHLVVEPVATGNGTALSLVVGFDHRVPSNAADAVAVIAADAAAAITRHDAMAVLAEEATHDPLTGVANRRLFDEALGRELSRAARWDVPVCVAVLDLDHFKAYNDAHGHGAGDDLLRRAAAAWSAGLRPTDLLARIGGEEFAVVLPDTAVPGAEELADRLRTSTPRDVTCSIGVAQWRSGESPEELVERADRALYAAKDGGRDRVETAAP